MKRYMAMALIVSVGIISTAAHGAAIWWIVENEAYQDLMPYLLPMWAWPVF